METLAVSIFLFMKIFRLRKDKVELFKSWAQEVSTSLLYESLEALKEENCTREIFIMFNIGQDTYIAAHMEGDDIVPSNAERSINIKHKEIMKECVDAVVDYDVLYDLSTTKPK